MELAELLLKLYALPRAEKLCVIQILADSLAHEEDNVSFRVGEAFPVWSPYDAHEAAQALLRILDQPEN